MTPLGLHHIMWPGHHYGPAPWWDRDVRPDWNSVYYHHADGRGVGFDRTATGSAAVSRYRPPVRDRFADLATCPEEFLLWFHHVPWDHRMRSGRTLWDELALHYQRGVDSGPGGARQWDALAGAIDAERHADVARRLAIQERDAAWWRDAVLLYFQTFSHRPLPAGGRTAGADAGRIQIDEPDPAGQPRVEGYSLSPPMKITDIKATSVTVPLEAPLRHANGCHWGRFVRTIVEVETDDGLIGLGEMGGGGESAEAMFRALKSYLVGHDPARLEQMRFLIANPTASLYNNRTQVLAALEFACLDILGQKWGVPVSEILGGRLQDRVPFASYLFFRYPNRDGSGEVRTAEQVVAMARELKARYGFTSHKLKGGVFPPEYELNCYRQLAAALDGDRFRFDPNGVWSTETAIWFGQQIEGIRNDYLEDPVFGMAGMRRVREKVRMPLATNTIVVNFEQLAANALATAADVILLDTTFWGGIRPCIRAAGVCETFQLGVAVHSSGELGIQLATMLHLGAVIPNLSFAADAHYHHLTDDIIAGGKLAYEGGSIAVPTGPGLGVQLDREKLGFYNDLYRRLGSYPYDQDPLRPGWAPTIPNSRWADPADARPPANIGT